MELCCDVLIEALAHFELENCVALTNMLMFLSFFWLPPCFGVKQLLTMFSFFFLNTVLPSQIGDFVSLSPFCALGFRQ